jgi:transcriptional regulator with XRE-family HTH domain
MPKKPDILVALGRRVRQLRKGAGINSQEALADRCGLDRTYIGGIERGERNVSLLNLAKIAKAMGVSVSELTEGL